jgi:hypothetical protein
MEGFVNVKKEGRRGKMYAAYLREFEPKDAYLDEHRRLYAEDMVTAAEGDRFTCPCGGTLVKDTAQALIICTSCAVAHDFQEMDGSNVTYDQEMNMESITFFAYQRANHFKEWLAQFQAKENTVIPDEVLDQLKAEFRKERVSSSTQITCAKVRHYLKKLKLTRWYEHKNTITTMLNGEQPERLSPALEERLIAMFEEIQAPWELHKPSVRSNFLSYSYCLYKVRACFRVGAEMALWLTVRVVRRHSFVNYSDTTDT